MIEATQTFSKIIHHLLVNPKCCSQEDVFFSIILPHYYPMKLPHWKESLKFSFEKAPKFCYKKLGHTLPFGCHYYSNQKYWNTFWKYHIDR